MAKRDQRRDAGALQRETFEGPGEPVFEEMSQAEADMEALFAEVGDAPDAAIVHVYKIEAEGREPKIWRGPPSNYDLERIAKSYGSGDYRVMVYSRAAGGQMVRRLNRVVPWLLTAEEDKRIRDMREGREPVNGAQAFSVEALVAAMKAAGLGAPAPVIQQQQNALGLIREVGEILRPLMARPVESQAFNGMAMIKEFAGMLREARREDYEDDPPRGAAGPWDALLKLIDRFGPLLEQQRMVGQPGAEGAPPALTDATTTAGADKPAPGKNVTTEQEEQLNRLKAGLAFLVFQASADNDPATYAAMIIDNVPRQDLEQWLAAPNWLDALSGIHPPVRQHAKWFNELHAAVVEELKDDGGDPPAGTDKAA